MAAQKGNSPAIKEFGRWIASDSVTLNKALVSLCQLENDYPRPVTSTSGMFLEQQLQTAKGKKFDQKFLQAVTDISDKNIHMYRAEEANGNNGNTPPVLQFYVKDAQPMLQAHLTEAQRLQHVEGFPVTAPPAMPTTAVPATGATVSPATTRTGTSGQSQAR
jgi:predicted outer membrane protein